MRVIGVAHTLVHHAGISRIQTDLRILTRYAIRPYSHSFSVPDEALAQNR